MLYGIQQSSIFLYKKGYKRYKRNTGQVADLSALISVVFRSALPLLFQGVRGEEYGE